MLQSLLLLLLLMMMMMMILPRMRMTNGRQQSLPLKIGELFEILFLHRGRSRNAVDSRGDGFGRGNEEL